MVVVFFMLLFGSRSLYNRTNNKLMMYIKLLSLTSLTILLSCGTQELTTTTKSKQIDLVSSIKPIEGLDNAKVTYRIDAQNPEPIALKRGGSLIFDKDAFVDSDGNLVEGEIDIQWEEFHTFGEIMFSGIPMKYDSAGVANNLESGGMFTINGSQNDNPVRFAPNKRAEVNLASIQDTPCYNFYKLDERSGDWSYETTATGEDIEDPLVEKEKESTTSEAKPEPNLIDVTLNTRNFIELKDLEIVAWRAKRELSFFDKSILQMTQTKTRLLKTDSLGLTLEARTYDKKVYQYPVDPYLMEEAIADSKSNVTEMEAELTEVSEYLENVEAGRVIRSIEIDNFGTFNWDCIHQFDQPQSVIASFDFPGDVNPDLISVFLLSPDENVVIRCNSRGDGSFFFDPNLRNCLIGILPNNEIVSISNDGFNGVRGQKTGRSYTFAFKETGIKLKSPADIMNHMNALI